MTSVEFPSVSKNLKSSLVILTQGKIIDKIVERSWACRGNPRSKTSKIRGRFELDLVFKLNLFKLFWAIQVQLELCWTFLIQLELYFGSKIIYSKHWNITLLWCKPRLNDLFDFFLNWNFVGIFNSVCKVRSKNILSFTKGPCSGILFRIYGKKRYFDQFSLVCWFYLRLCWLILLNLLASQSNWQLA